MTGYHYRSPVGTFWIVPDHDHPSRWVLGIDHEALGNYASARLAADDVYTQHSGSHEWDTLDPVRTLMAPNDITEWESGQPDL